MRQDTKSFHGMSTPVSERLMRRDIERWRQLQPHWDYDVVSHDIGSDRCEGKQFTWSWDKVTLSELFIGRIKSSSLFPPGKVRRVMYTFNKARLFIHSAYFHFKFDHLFHAGINEWKVCILTVFDDSYINWSCASYWHLLHNQFSQKKQ